MPSKPINLRLPTDLLKRIDKAAGPRKRTEWIVQACEEKLGADVASTKKADAEALKAIQEKPLRDSPYVGAEKSRVLETPLALRNGDEALVRHRMTKLEPFIPSLLARRRTAIEELTKEGKL
jgi:hypothetical protein